MTLISRLLGFIRDILIAATFGAGSIADAFFIALKFPNIFRTLNHLHWGIFPYKLSPVARGSARQRNSPLSVISIFPSFSFDRPAGVAGRISRIPKRAP